VRDWEATWLGAATRIGFYIRDVSAVINFVVLMDGHFICVRRMANEWADTRYD